MELEAVKPAYGLFSNFGCSLNFACFDGFVFTNPDWGKNLQMKSLYNNLTIGHYKRRFGRLTQNEVFSGFIKILAKLVNYAENSSNFIAANHSGRVCYNI